MEAVSCEEALTGLETVEHGSFETVQQEVCVSSCDLPEVEVVSWAAVAAAAAARS